jgi:predicted phage terminase large subunit-like protein
MEELTKEQLIQKIIEKQAILTELKRRKYLEDLYTFNVNVLKATSLGELAVFHKELCDFIMTPSRRKLLLVPRSHLKSTLVTVGYTLYRIAQDPKVRILIANATYDMATTFLSQIKKHLQTNPIFRELYGDLSTGADKWSENMISVPTPEAFVKKEATVTAYGVGGNLVSQHYDLIIMDDIVNRDFVNTPEQIMKTILFYKDALDLLEPTGKLIIIGTRWHQMDLYGWIMDKTNPEGIYKFFDVFFRQAYEGNLETGENFTPLFPQKYNRENLLQLKAEKGPIEFQSQYMNNCMPGEDAKFKKEWINVVLEDELRWRNINYYTMVDPAIGQSKDSDKTAIVTIGVDQFNNWFVVSIVWGNMLPNQIIDRIFDNWELFHPRQIGIEMTAFQKSLKYGLTDEMRKRNIFLPFVELTADKSKMERIEGLIPRYANGMVFHLQTCPHREILEEEMLWYPRGKHDDVLDALAYGMQISHPSKKKETHWHGGKHTDEDEDSKRERQWIY